MAHTPAPRTAARRLRRVVAQAVWAVVVLVLLTLVAGTAAIATDKARVLTVLSGSMSPALPVGSLLLDLPMDPEDVRPGDVITFTRPDGQVVTHRVIELSTSETGVLAARTQGDANNVPDDWDVTLSGGTVWVVRHHIPGLGAGLAPLTSSALLPMATAVLPLLLAGLWLRAIWSAPRNGNGTQAEVVPHGPTADRSSDQPAADAASHDLVGAGR